jgi:hypothetical protein
LQALDLKPNYVRAWSNMGIGYANQVIFFISNFEPQSIYGVKNGCKTLDTNHLCCASLYFMVLPEISTSQRAFSSCLVKGDLLGLSNHQRMTSYHGSDWAIISAGEV